MTECPFAPLLDLDAMGTDGDRSTLDDHINGCPACQARIQARIDQGDTCPWTPPTMGGLPDFPGLEIEAELGRGGMGVVFKAWDPRAARHVALKIVPGGPANGHRGRDRWLREARSLTRVNHPNVVRLYQVEESGHWLCLVLEYVAGGSLADRLKGPMAARDAAELLRPVALAVAEIHREGMLHLDLKPSNILLDSPSHAPWRDARPRVADFGIARSEAELDGSRTTLAAPAGSPSYMAPEQAECRPGAFGPATDIHAMGATLYELLTGRPPFAGASALETLEQVRSRDPVPPRSLNPRIPRDLETIALKCLQKDPSRRYATADALADDLDRWLEGRPLKAKPVSAVEVAWRWCRRNPVVALLTTALIAGLLAGFLGAVWISWRLDADRLEAEANAQAASEALAQLLRADFDIATRIYEPETFVPNFMEIRSILVDLAGRPANGLSFHRQLARANHVLGDSLIRGRQHEQAWAYFEESLRLSEEYLQAHPGDIIARKERMSALTGLAEVAAYRGDEHACLSYESQGMSEAEGLVEHSPQTIPYLAKVRGDLADRFARQGDNERAKLLLEANLRMLEQAPPEAEGPELTAARAFERMNFPRGGVRRDRGHLADLGSSDSDDQDPTQWAEFALACLQAARRCSAEPDQEFRDAMEFAIRLTLLNAEQRHGDRLDLAKQTADRTLALGRILVAIAPQSADAHMVVGEGYIQLYKNAWNDEDRAAIRLNLKLSIDAVHRALMLVPNHVHAKAYADQRQIRLKKIDEETRPADGG